MNIEKENIEDQPKSYEKKFLVFLTLFFISEKKKLSSKKKGMEQTRFH